MARDPTNAYKFQREDITSETSHRPQIIESKEDSVTGRPALGRVA
jgi:hypothetical protein